MVNVRCIVYRTKKIENMFPENQVTPAGKDEPPSGPSNKAMDQNTTSLPLGFVNKIETLVEVLP